MTFGHGAASLCSTATQKKDGGFRGQESGTSTLEAMIATESWSPPISVRTPPALPVRISRAAPFLARFEQ